MAAKRPKFNVGDRVKLADHTPMIPAYDGKPPMLRDTILTVRAIEGRGTERMPWRLVLGNGTHTWYLDPDAVVSADPPPAVTWDQVTAMSYAGYGGSARADRMLSHLRVKDDFRVGRLQREAGDALCRRVKPENLCGMVDLPRPTELLCDLCRLPVGQRGFGPRKSTTEST